MTDMKRPTGPKGPPRRRNRSRSRGPRQDNNGARPLPPPRAASADDEPRRYDDDDDDRPYDDDDRDYDRFEERHDEPGDDRDAREARDADRAIRPRRDPLPAPRGREPREAREPRESRDPRDAREPRDVRDDHHEDDGHEEPAMPKAASSVAEPLAPSTSAPRGVTPRFQPSDEYQWQVHFDKAARQFVGTVLEFPEIKATGANRDIVQHELETMIDEHLEGLKRRNEKLPEPFHSRHFPEVLELKISQNLFRKLDHRARAEKVTVEQWVTELLTALSEGRIQGGGGGGQRHHQGPQHNSNREQGHGGGRNDRGHRGGGKHRGYNNALENRENFMEYVRNLEKGGGGSGGGGGGGGGWKKR